MGIDFKSKRIISLEESKLVLRLTFKSKLVGETDKEERDSFIKLQKRLCKEVLCQGP